MFIAIHANRRRLPWLIVIAALALAVGLVLA